LGPLLRKLEGIDDPRAHACRQALATTPWNVDVVQSQVVGSGDGSRHHELQLLHNISALDVPERENVDEAVRKLREAAEGLDRVAGTDADRMWEIADMLSGAVKFHDQHGPTDCPVCGRASALDAEWRTRTAQQIDELRIEANEVRLVREAAERALSQAGKILSGPPGFLLESETVGINSRLLREGWGRWHEARDLTDPGNVADRMTKEFDDLVKLVVEARAQASALLQEREDLWRPLAQQLDEWLLGARPAQEGIRHLKSLKKGEDWIKRAQGEIRDERFEPIAKRAQAIWNLLRAQSHVDLARPSLEGAGTQRRVRLEVTVDGVAGAALGVMSQGELHSLALSLFLPRATMEESPFRFVFIDDPVQSMDPARVDGLARVLEESAQTRQVVVFTHDDRLPAAVRSLRIDARVVEVSRRGDSSVELRPASDPVTRYFADAFALVKSEGIPEKVTRRVVPGLCRSGVEAACTEAFRRRRLARGESHQEVEDALLRATTTTLFASLALFDDLEHGGAVLGEINRNFGRREADAFQASKKGAHQGYDGDLIDLVRYSGELAKAIQVQS
jgi:hypothetical protein